MILRSNRMDLKKMREPSWRQAGNEILNIQESRMKLAHLGSFPRRIVLELTNACNLRCIMCGRDEAEFKPMFMPLSYLDKIAPLLDYAEEVTLFGWGEPTIHPKFDEVLEWLNKYPVQKYFVTNGMKLIEKSRAILLNNVDMMAVSLDGPTPEINDSIRVGSSFEKIVDGIRTINNYPDYKQIKYRSPYINLVFTAMKSNIRHLPAMIGLAHELNIEEVKVVYLTVFSEKLKDESLWGVDISPILNASEIIAEDLGIKLKLPYLQGGDPAGSALHKECIVGWRDLFIGCDGWIRPCQSTSQKLGHIDSFDWNSEEYQYFRMTANDANSMPEGCRRCYQSSHSNVNRKEAFIQIGEKFTPEWGKCEECPSNGTKPPCEECERWGKE